MKDREKTSRVAVIGLGNPLMGDDGFGPAVVELLHQTYVFGPHVRVVDLGTPGPGLCTEVLDLEYLFVIDTLTGPGPPGTVHTTPGSELTRVPRSPRISPHEPTLSDALALAALAGRAPETVTVIGVVPDEVALGIGLSRVVEAAVLEASSRVLGELEQILAPEDRTPRAIRGSRTASRS